MTDRRALAPVLLLVASTLVSSPARADDPPAPSGVVAPASAPAPQQDVSAEAKEAYRLGAEAFTAKRFVEAALHFESASSQRPHAISLFMAAVSWEKANRPEHAADAYDRTLSIAGLTAEQASQARDRVAALERTLGTVAVVGPEGWRVQLDQLTEVDVPARLHGVPGNHLLVIRPKGERAVERRDVTLHQGKITRVELTEEGDAPKTEVAAPPKPEVVVRTVVVEQPTWFTTRRGLGVGALGVGAASALGALVLGTQALGAKDAYDAKRTQAGYDHASALQTWTNVAWVTAGVFIAGGAVLVLWPSPDKSEKKIVLAPAAGGAVLRGAF